MFKTNFLWMLLVCLCLQISYAQTERTIRGTVRSATTKEALPGVSVRVKETSSGVTTDANGNFTLRISGTAKNLLFSSIGLKSKEVALQSANQLDVELEDADLGLNEVVVVGYGTQRRGEVSGAISSVKGASIENLPSVSLDKAMQGRAAGVQVNSNNGLPGGASEVRIRGVGSVNAGNQPLYIVDGVQINPAVRSVNLASSNPLSGINANDIESIDILKDAAAASVYGAQAGNGVVIITTKKGKSGTPRFNLNAYAGNSEILKKPNLLTGPQWVELTREGAVNSGDLTAAYNADITNGLAANAPTYDWMDAVTRRGAVQNYELSVNGGTDNTKYYLGGSFNDTKYHFVGYDFKRGTFRANLDNKLSEKVSLETRVNLSTVSQHSSDIPSFQLYNIFITGLSGAPVDPIYNEDGSYNTNLRGWDNPLLVAEQNKNWGVTNQLVGNFALNYDILPGLKFRSSYSLEYSSVNEERFYDPRNNAGAAVGGSVYFNDSRVVNWQTDQTLTYSKVFHQDHNFNALLGFNYRNEVFTKNASQGNGVATPAFGNTLTGTTPVLVSSSYDQFKLAGVFGRIGYTFKNKYIAQFTLRRDGSSRFGANNVYGYFPAASAAWRLVDEDFMQTVPVFSELKLRASYGETGNSELMINTAGVGSYYPALSLFSTSAEASYNGGAGISFFQLGNANLGWERNVTKNIGLDYGLFKGRINGSLDYFIRTTKDLLLNRPLPNTSGFATIAENVGSLENRGLEIGLSTLNLVGDFKWSTDINFTFLKNKVLSLVNDGQDLPASNLWVGRPLGERYLVKWAGVNPADGRPMWYDQYDEISYVPVAADRRFGIGSNLIPDYYGGFTNNFSYKGFELGVFFQFQVGTVQQDQPTGWLLSDFRYAFNQDASILNRWTSPGQITDIPRIYPGATFPGTSNSIFGSTGAESDRFYSDASYIRLKTVTLGYTLPSLWLEKARISSARIYLQGYNLWTGTHYTGLDPEFTAGGYNMGLAPQGKSYTLGIQLGF